MICGKEEPINSEYLFCKSLAKQTNELTTEKNMLARIKVQQILLQKKFDKQCEQMSHRVRTLLFSC